MVEQICSIEVVEGDVDKKRIECVEQFDDDKMIKNVLTHVDKEIE